MVLTDNCEGLVVAVLAIRQFVERMKMLSLKAARSEVQAMKLMSWTIVGVAKGPGGSSQ